MSVLQNRSQDDVQVYKSFLDMPSMYRKKRKKISEAYLEVNFIA